MLYMEGTHSIYACILYHLISLLSANVNFCVQCKFAFVGWYAMKD
jgi:hypothetical protein